MKRPVIAITMGDPAGVGPEVVVKALSQPDIYDLCRPLVVGTAAALQQALRLVKAPPTLHPIEEVDQGLFATGALDLIDIGVDTSSVSYGQLSADAGRAARESILRAVALVQEGQAQALATAPINKEAIALAGHPELGHLELLAQLSGALEYATMLMSGPLRTVHLSTHHSLRQALALVTQERVLARLRLIQRCFGEWGLERPRIGVAALNPHAGEGGLLGREEIEDIAPAVADAQRDGIDARGPYPADSIFSRALAGEFDVVLALYHDQGHIPIKVYGFERSVSVALGLPFIRTSVDHGTAFDIAGKGVANPLSMANAIKVAAALCRGDGLIEV